MKICLFGNRLSLLSGHSVGVYELAKQLMAKKHEVIIVTNRLPKKMRAVNETLIKQKGFQNLKIVFAFDSLRDFLFKKKELRKTLEPIFNDLDIIQIYDLTTCYFLAKLFDNKLPVPSVCCMRDIPKLKIKHLLDAGPSIWLRFFVVPFWPFSLILPKNFIKKVLNIPDKIVVSCHFIKETLIKDYNIPQSKIVVVNPVINLDRFNKVNKFETRNTFTYFYYGWTSSMRGTFDAIKAFLEVQRRTNGSKLIVASDIPWDVYEGKYLVKKLKKRYASEDIIFKGFHEDIIKLIKSTNVVVLPFRSVFSYAQPPIVVLNAMASRKPVISTNVGSIKEVLKNNRTGFVVPKRDIKALSRKMILLKNNPDLAKKMGENAYRFIDKNFSVKKVLTKYINLYNSLKQERKKDKYASKRLYSAKTCANTYDKKRFTSYGGKLFDKIDKSILLKNVPKEKNVKILECGTGTGRLAIELAKYGYNVLATDVSFPLMRKLKEKISNLDLQGNIKVQHEDIFQLSFPDNSFDFVYAIRVINIIGNNQYKKEAINELCRVVKSGGIVLFDIVNKNSLAFFKKRDVHISTGEAETIIKQNTDLEIIKKIGRLTFSQTVLELPIRPLAFLISKIDQFFSDISPILCTRIYFVIKKK